MKHYIIAGVLTLTLILLIVGTTLLTINEVDIGEIKILSIEGMQEKEQELELATAGLETTETQYKATESRLNSSKDSYESAKYEYSQITETQIETIKQETKEKVYNLDWMWIILGEYAEVNNLDLHVIDSRTGPEQRETDGPIQIRVDGRYLDIANFVFEVENDITLMFKLDNMSMQYNGDNKVLATFDVLDIGVIF